MRIAYCGYDFFWDCFKMLCEKEGIEIIKTYTFETDNVYNYNSRLISTAHEYGIPISLEKISEREVEKLFNYEGCEYIISAAYPYKIPIGNFKGINIHPTLLPIGRGPWPLPRVILSEQKESGVTLHKLVNELDSGDILLQEKFSLLEREDLETLSCRCQMLAVKLLSQLFDNIDFYWESATAQGEGEYWGYPTDEEMTFDGNMTVDEIDRIVRAYGKFDSCVNFLDKSWLVWDVNCWKEEHSYIPGTIVHQTNKEYLMAVKDGFVCLRFFKEDE